MLVSKGLKEFEEDLLFKEFDTIILVGTNSSDKHKSSTIIVAPNKTALKQAIDVLKEAKERSPNVIITNL